MTAELPALVSVDWLAAHLNHPRLRVIDGSWYLPGSGRDPRAEYRNAHIPGAVFFDLDATSDQSTTLPHMLPSAEFFADRMAELGLNDEDDLVIYDGSGVNLSAPRVWWTFRVFGHPRVAVLDGGLQAWKRSQRPLESGSVALPRGRFSARFDPALVRDLESIRRNLVTRSEQLVDARPAGRFAGRDPEPRPGLRSGHVPGSVNLPFTELVTASGTMLPEAELRDRIEAAGVNLSRPVVATCGSGTSACSLILALHLLGHEAALYDGAWAEWGSQPDTPVSFDADR